MLPILLLSALNPLALFPDSVDVVVRNSIDDASILSVHCIVNGSSTLTRLWQEAPVRPGECETFRVPFRYLGRIIFVTDTMGNYRKVAVAPAPAGDTLTVSREDREFGGFFDVVMGSRPHVIRNTSPVPLAGVFLHADSGSAVNLLGTNPLMTDETIFLWLDRDSIVISAVDTEGNPSDTMTFVRSDADSVRVIGTLSFMGGVERPAPGNIWVINGINGGLLSGIEVYPLDGEPFFMDLTDTPLELWQSAVIPFSGEIEYLICTDTEGRSFSINAADAPTGAFVADWWHLDFDYSFPERRRR